MTEENVSPNPSSPRRDDRLRRPLPERTSGSAHLSDEAKAYLNAVVPRLDAERYEISWDEFDCIAKLSRFEWSKFGFVDYTFVFEEFDRLDARSLWDFSRTAFEYAARRGGWSLPGLQGAKILPAGRSDRRRRRRCGRRTQHKRPETLRQTRIPLRVRVANRRPALLSTDPALGSVLLRRTAGTGDADAGPLSAEYCDDG